MLLETRKQWQGCSLSEDMATVNEYLQTRKLQLSIAKTVSVVFHLNNKEAKRVNQSNETDTSSHFAKS